MLREFVFKTRADANPLCAFTRDAPERWIVIHLFRPAAREAGSRALFVIRAPGKETNRFLTGAFAKRYGTFERLHQEGDVTSVEVSNYAMPAYRGMDPVEMAIRFLGPDVVFEPILVHDGYIHVKVLAVQRTGRPFKELTDRLTSATDPSDFRLIHQGEWDPRQRLAPRDDALTERQRETLRMAIDLGYYDAPRRCTLEDLAGTFGVSKAAVHKHLQAAEGKVLKNHPL